MNSLSRNNNSGSNHSNRRAAVAAPPNKSDEHVFEPQLPTEASSTSLKSFIERQDSGKCTQRRREESSEVAVIVPAAAATTSSAVPRGTPSATNAGGGAGGGEPIRRVQARTRSFRRASSSRQLLQTQSLHGAMILRAAQLNDEKEEVKVVEPPIRERKSRMSITARDFADLIAAPSGHKGTADDEPVKLSFDIPRVVAEMTAMNVLPPSFTHTSGAHGRSQPESTTASARRASLASIPAATAHTEGHERARRRSSTRIQSKEGNSGSSHMRRASSDVGGTIDKEWEQQPNVRRSVSLDDKNLEVMNVPVLRRRSSVHDGRKGRTQQQLVESSSDHQRPPRHMMPTSRPSYREAPFAISAGSDRSSQRSESITSREDDVQALEFLASFSEFSELTDEWEPNAVVRRAKSFDDPKILHDAKEHPYRSRSLSEDLTSPTERSSGIYSDASRTYSRPPRQPSSHHRGGWNHSPSTPSSSAGSSSAEPSSVLLASAHQRGVGVVPLPRRTSSSLLLHRQHPKSDEQGA